MTQATVNNNLILLGGKSAAGKSASLMNLRNPEGVWYFNCESGKKLLFRSKFRQFTITDPYQVYEGFDAAQADDGVHTLVIDSQTYLLDMYESLYVQPAADGRKAWGELAKYFKDLMQIYVARSSKNVIFIAHTLDQLNESDMIMETKVSVKGALKNNGIESYFSQVIAAKKMTLKALESYESDLLNITDEERALGFKYVFQTKLTKETVGERVRGTLGLFDYNETFIDNNMQLVLDRLHKYCDN